MSAFKSNLQAMRKRAGYKSAKAFAEHIGMSVDTYTSYEQGKTSMSLLKAWEFADILHCTLDELAGRKSPKQAEHLSESESRLIVAYQTASDETRDILDDIASRTISRAESGAVKNAGIA